MINLVFGGAGFIGSNLVHHLLQRGQRAIVFDDMSLGNAENLRFMDQEDIVIGNINNSENMLNFSHKLEPLDPAQVNVWHLAANSDIIRGVGNSDVDYEKTFLTTRNILKFMRNMQFEKLYFSSTSAVYGDKGNDYITETSGDLHPISNYGAYKLASEAIISAARETFLKHVIIFRFPNVFGTPATHGVILDFVNKLKATPENLSVLGDGTQQKSYIHVSDLVNAMQCCVDTDHTDRLPVFNIGNIDQGTSVKQIAEIVVKHASPNAQITYGVEPRGWKGNIPYLAMTSFQQKFLSATYR